MPSIVKDDWNDESLPWLEEHLQMAVAQWLRREGICFAGDQNAGKRSRTDGARRKAAGMAAGEPDLRLYFADGLLVFIELKTATGSLNDAQKKRIPELQALGFTVHVVAAASPGGAVEAVKELFTDTREGKR